MKDIPSSSNLVNLSQALTAMWERSSMQKLKFKPLDHVNFKRPWIHQNGTDIADNPNKVGS